MKFGSRLGSLFIAFTLALGLTSPAQFPGTGDKNQLTTSLIADTTAIEAGKPFTVGVRFEILPEWYIYWQFVGDIGMPTSVEWELPEGFTAGPLQWPLPTVHLGTGDFLNYVYEHETLIFAEVTPPATLSPGPLTIKAKLNWQVCDPQTCVPGKAELALALATGSAQPANAELFAKWRSHLPKREGRPFSVKWERSAREVKLHLSGLPKDFKAEFFPLPASPAVKPGHPQVSAITDDGARTITVPIAEGGVPDLAWEGIIATAKGEAPREGWLVSTKDDGTAVVGAAAGPAAAPDSKVSLLGTLWAAFLGGLILNLMPCVLPVIALKIFGFVAQAKEEPRRVFRLGLAFVAGVFVFFLGLAALVIVVKAGGGRFNWGFQFQNAYILTTLIALVFVFAMSMLGVFEFTLGSGAATKLDALSGREGYGGAFVHGLFTTLLGTSCTAPFLGPVLGFAVGQPAPSVIAIFLAIAAGMSLPYFLLTWKPAWMKYLPKPGVWMERIKQFMGFVLLAVVVWLLGVLGQSRGAEALTAVCGFLLLLGLASWIFGAFRGRVLAWPAIALVLVIGWVGFVRDGLSAAAAARGSAQNVVQPGGIAWQKFSPERLAEALKSGQPVFIDFTADWCLNCKYNERFVLETAPVQAAFREKKIIAFKADWTNGDPVISEMLKKLNRAGVPVYVIYQPGSQEPILLPEILTQTLLLRHLGEIKS